jgi:membrane protease YdiL (CAAX protease family)
MGSPPPLPPPPVPPLPPQVRRIPRWGLGDAVLAFVLSTFGGVIGELIAIAATGAKAGSDGHIKVTAPILLGAVVGQFGAWFGAIYSTSRFKGFRSLRADFGFVVFITDWYLLAIGAACQIVAVAALRPIAHFVDQGQEVVQELNDARGPKLVLLAVLAVVVAPAVEELFFRGLLLRALQRRGSATCAVAVSAILFGLAHVVFDWSSRSALPALVALGMISGILAVRTGNLSRSILLHAGFNLLPVLAVLTNH